jgi:hypothetical protein
MPAYLDAARRHVADASHLLAEGRIANSDHLAGFGAECCIKALLCGVAGVPLPLTGPPTVSGTKFEHLPGLWANAALYVSGRNSSSVVFAGANPFAQWDVGDRYELGSLIAPARASAHVSEATKLWRIAEQASIDGLLP